jgi:hypothetical protein
MKTLKNLGGSSPPHALFTSHSNLSTHHDHTIGAHFATNRAIQASGGIATAAVSTA